MTERSVPDRLHSLAIHLLRRVRPADLAAGLTAARLSVLSVLVFGEARTVTELADAEQVSLPTMTRLLQGLERDGYVRRRRGRSDGRVVEIFATARGRRALETARARRVARVAALLAGLSAQELSSVERALSVLERELGRSARARGSA
jgi:DNA-binding MarR family transcriptional regulator